MAFKRFLVIFVALIAVIEFTGRCRGQLSCTLRPCGEKVRYCIQFFLNFGANGTIFVKRSFSSDILLPNSFKALNPLSTLSHVHSKGQKHCLHKINQKSNTKREESASKFGYFRGSLRFTLVEYMSAVRKGINRSPGINHLRNSDSVEKCRGFVRFLTNGHFKLLKH